VPVFWKGKAQLMRLLAVPALPKIPSLGEDGLSDPQAKPGGRQNCGARVKSEYKQVGAYSSATTSSAS
jgi:hypothetical protein